MARIILQTSLGYLLKQASSALHNAMDEVLRPHGLTITEYACLELLAQRPGLSNSELARGVFVTRQSMNVVLQSLAELGIVSRADRPESGRALPTELTPAGRTKLKAASAAVSGVETRMLSRLDERDQGELHRMLTACIDGLRD